MQSCEEIVGAGLSTEIREAMMTSRWLLPFTFGVDMQAFDAALSLTQNGNSTLVTLSLITVPSGRRSRGARLEDIQQSQDFLETVKHRAARFATPVELHEVYTENVLASLETLPRKLECEGMILLSRGEQALLLKNEEMQQILSTVPVPLMLIYLPRQSHRNGISHLVTRFSSLLQRQRKNVIARPHPLTPEKHQIYNQQQKQEHLPLF